MQPAVRRVHLPPEAAGFPNTIPKDAHEETAMDHSQDSATHPARAIGRRTILKAAGALAAPLVPRFAKAANEIPIGVVVGLTGSGADYGRDAQRAFQLVADRVNRSGGIKSLGGATLKLIVADHQSDLRVASSETERLITRENVLGILGWAASGPARVGSEVSERYKVPAIDTSVDYKLTERGLKYFYRAAINTRQTCERGVEFVREMEKASGVAVKRVAILHEDLAYGTGAGDLYKAAIEKMGGWQLVDRVAYTAAKLNEATGIVNKLKAQNVDVVFQASYPADGILIQRAMKQLRLNLFANVHPAGAPPNLQYVGNLKDDADYVITALGWTPAWSTGCRPDPGPRWTSTPSATRWRCRTRPATRSAPPRPWSPRCRRSSRWTAPRCGRPSTRSTWPSARIPA